MGLDRQGASLSVGNKVTVFTTNEEVYGIGVVTEIVNDTQTRVKISQNGQTFKFNNEKIEKLTGGGKRNRKSRRHRKSRKTRSARK